MLDANKLNKLAKEKGLSRYEIAKLTGLAESNINRIFNGEITNPTILTAYKIAKVLGVRIEDLLNE